MIKCLITILILRMKILNYILKIFKWVVYEYWNELMFRSVKIGRYDWSVFGGFWLVWIKMWGALPRRFFQQIHQKKGGSRCGVGVTAGGHQKSKNKICEMEMKIIKEAWQIDFGNEFSPGYVHILKQDTEVWTVFSITREKSKWSITSENKWDLGWLRNDVKADFFWHIPILNFAH